MEQKQKPATPQQYAATARFHERMAKAFESVGKTEDAKAARKAADLCSKAAK